MSTINDGSYKKCFIKGKGEFVDYYCGIKEFTVHDISPNGADILFTGDLPKSDIHNVKVTFDMQFLQKNIMVSARAMQIEDSSDTYYLEFVNLKDEHRIEIDEILRHMEDDVNNALETGDVKLNHFHQKKVF